MTERGRRRLLGGLLLAAAVVALAWAARLAQAPPAGPVPIAWDRERCARCGMLVSEPRFAAQLQTRDGDVLSFDDPGCLLVFQHEHAPELRAIWFHHSREDRWVPGEEARFAPVEPTPMGYGLGAVTDGAPESLAVTEAREHALGRERARSGR